jgi:hypothetical protein
LSNKIEALIFFSDSYKKDSLPHTSGAMMRISSSNVSLASSQISVKTSSVQEYLRKWDKNSDITYSSEKINTQFTAQSMKKKDFVQVAHLNSPRIIKSHPAFAAINQDNLAKRIKDEFLSDVKSQIIIDMIEAMTGKKIQFLKLSDIQNAEGSPESSEAPQNPEQGQPPPQLEGWGIDYRYKETHYSKEGVSFAASGSVKTTDGKSIEFNVSLEISRESYEELSVSLKAGDALKDPLVIDLTGNGVGFTGAKFEFDIDVNGANELISAPKPGTGFLAYDRNGNGIVDNGSELFGPLSGKGFSELKQLDEDKNGWIDENDSAYKSLKIWQKTDDGADQVSTLLESGIGAIYAGSAQTEFTITGDNGKNSLVAAIVRETGIYLRENGGAGVIHELDLVV